MRLLLILFVFTASSFTAVSQWEEYTSFEGKFRILTPGEMKVVTSEIETAIGGISYNTLLHKPEIKNADNLAYLVSYCDYPEESVHSDSLALMEDFFATTIEEAVKSVKGTLMYSTEIEIEKYPGRLWRIDYNDGAAMIKTKAYLVGRRYYSVQTITLKDKSLNPFIDKFLDSFYLIE